MVTKIGREFEKQYEVRDWLKHIDRYDCSNQWDGRVLIGDEQGFRRMFPGIYSRIRELYPLHSWKNIIKDVSYVSDEEAPRSLRDAI